MIANTTSFMKTKLSWPVHAIPNAQLCRVSKIHGPSIATILSKRSKELSTSTKNLLEQLGFKKPKLKWIYQWQFQKRLTKLVLSFIWFSGRFYLIFYQYYLVYTFIVAIMVISWHWVSQQNKKMTKITILFYLIY